MTSPVIATIATSARQKMTRTWPRSSRARRPWRRPETTWIIRYTSRNLYMCAGGERRRRDHRQDRRQRRIRHRDGDLDEVAARAGVGRVSGRGAGVHDRALRPAEARDEPLLRVHGRERLGTVAD